MTRRVWIERCLRQIYNGMPADDATITINLVNVWLQTAIGLAAKANYKDNIAIDGIGYINNSFYTTFTGITISSNGNFIWRFEIPQLPLGVGANDGISVLELTDGVNVTRSLIPLTEAQRSIYKSIRPIPNKVLYYYEGKYGYVVSTLLLSSYTANVTMVSGGDNTNLDSELNVPADYDNVMIDYIKQQLLFERQLPVDATNDGLDAIVTT